MNSDRKIINLLICAAVFGALLALIKQARADDLPHCLIGDNDSGGHTPFEFVAIETTPEWRACHDQYWEQVRLIREEQGRYNRCLGTIQNTAGFARSRGIIQNDTILHYAFPLHPVEGNRANDIPNCIAHRDAAFETRLQFADAADKCEAKEKAIIKKLQGKFGK